MRLTVYTDILRREATISAMQDPSLTKLHPLTPRVDGVRKYSATPNSEFYPTHPGIDLIGKRGDKIYAREGGRIWIGKDLAGAAYVMITTADGGKERYYHMSNLTAAKTVKKGDQIGLMSDEGDATGVHLHFDRTNPDGSWADAYALVAGLSSAVLLPYNAKDFNYTISISHLDQGKADEVLAIIRNHYPDTSGMRKDPRDKAGRYRQPTVGRIKGKLAEAQAVRDEAEKVTGLKLDCWN